MTSKERIMCSAIWWETDDHTDRARPTNCPTGIVFSGHRHHNCISQFKTVFYPDYQNNEDQDNIRIDFLRNSKQGFLTTKNKYIGRKKGLMMAVQNNQIMKGVVLRSQLYSEDLW